MPGQVLAAQAYPAGVGYTPELAPLSPNRTFLSYLESRAPWNPADWWSRDPRLEGCAGRECSEVPLVFKVHENPMVAQDIKDGVSPFPFCSLYL
jgi:hypothetical protein